MKTIRISLLTAIGVCAGLQLASAQWGLNGNAISSTNFIGSTNNQTFSVRTNNTERMKITGTGDFYLTGLTGTGPGILRVSASGGVTRINFTGSNQQVLGGNGSFVDIGGIAGWTQGAAGITSSGGVNVGIGVANPTAALDVSGSVKLSGSLTLPSLNTVTPTSSSHKLMVLNNSSSGAELISPSDLIQLGYAPGPGDLDPNLCLALWDPTLCTSTYTTTPVWKNVAGAGILFANCVNVGINNPAPTYALDVSGHERVTGNIGVGGAPNCSTKVYVYSAGSEDLIRYNNSNGTQFKVDHNGFLTCRDIKVTLNPIPDYVFEPDYKLLTIEEVKNYVTENKHLPNVPSADEMVANGTTLGEINMKLLEKVEELTLYIIQLEERIAVIEKTEK